MSSKLAFLLLCTFVLQAHAERTRVDLLLVIAADTSGSVDRAEYALQVEGIVEALKDPEVKYVVESCNGGGVAMTYVEWAGIAQGTNIKQIVDWKLIRNGQALNAMATDIRRSAKRQIAGQTDIVTALRFSQSLLDNAPYESERKIISISGDGEHSIADPSWGETYVSDNFIFEEDMRRTRDLVVSLGTTIDALAITKSESGLSVHYLATYFDRNVKGGPAGFADSVSNYADYANAFKKMLLRELNNCMF